MDKKHFESYRQLGLNIRFYRSNKNYTQEELAEIIDASIVHMGQIERAECGVSLDVLFDIAKALEIPVYKLFEFRI